MNTPITISIITVCYNAERVISRTLRSVSAQDYPYIEHLIIDGASKDGTLDCVRQFSPHALIHSEPDQGIYDAMNKGLNLATGQYVWFLNAGDALPSVDMVSTIAAAIRSSVYAPDVVYGDCWLIDDEDRILGPRRLRPPRELSWRSFIAGMTVCHQSFVARRALCPEYDLRYRLSSDVDWCIRVMKQAEHFHYIDAPISLYLREGASTRQHRRSLLERFDVMRRHYGLLPTLGAHVGFLMGLR